MRSDQFGCDQWGKTRRHKLTPATNTNLRHLHKYTHARAYSTHWMTVEQLLVDFVPHKTVLVLQGNILDTVRYWLVFIWNVHDISRQSDTDKTHWGREINSNSNNNIQQKNRQEKENKMNKKETITSKPISIHRKCTDRPLIWLWNTDLLCISFCTVWYQVDSVRFALFRPFQRFYWI